MDEHEAMAESAVGAVFVRGADAARGGCGHGGCDRAEGLLD